MRKNRMEKYTRIQEEEIRKMQSNSKRSSIYKRWLLKLVVYGSVLGILACKGLDSCNPLNQEISGRRNCLPSLDTPINLHSQASSSLLLSTQTGSTETGLPGIVGQFDVEWVVGEMQNDSNLSGVEHIAKLFQSANSLSSRPSFCTGFMISKNHMLTAGHCFYDETGMRDPGKSALSEEPGGGCLSPSPRIACVEFSSLNNSEDFTQVTANHRSQIRAVKEIKWVSHEEANNINTKYDFAIIEIKPYSDGKGAGEVWGYFALNNLTNYMLPAGKLYRAGFGHFPSHPGHLRGRFMHIDRSGSCTFTLSCLTEFRPSSKSLFHRCDSWGGDSGAPVVHYGRMINGRSVVVGIHVSGIRSTTNTPNRAMSTTKNDGTSR